MEMQEEMRNSKMDKYVNIIKSNVQMIIVMSEVKNICRTTMSDNNDIKGRWN